MLLLFSIRLAKQPPFWKRAVLCVSFVNVCQFVLSFVLFAFENGMWNINVLISDRFLSVYFI